MANKLVDREFSVELRDADGDFGVIFRHLPQRPNEHWHSFRLAPDALESGLSSLAVIAEQIVTVANAGQRG